MNVYQVYIDGKFYSPEDAQISILDHGFLFGNGAFTTLMTRFGKMFLVDAHLDRLFESARLINIPTPWTKEEVRQALVATHEKSLTRLGVGRDAMRSRIRINISRGAGDDVTVESALNCKPSLSIIVSKYPETRPEILVHGLKMCTVEVERVFPRSKNFNFLPSVLANQEAKQKGFDDAFFVDRLGHVTEATTGNLFYYKGDRLITPPLSMLEGITRKEVVQLARERGEIVVERDVKLEELKNADEVFVTGTTKLILPVTRINEFQVGSGQPGPKTMALREALEQHLFFEESKM